jgi:hypothetical protein
MESYPDSNARAFWPGLLIECALCSDCGLESNERIVEDRKKCVAAKSAFAPAGRFGGPLQQLEMTR